MTNKEKFIEIMNQTFNAGLTEDSLITSFWKFGSERPCSPCGLYKDLACDSYTCEGCKVWWNKEYVEPKENKFVIKLKEE